MSKKPEPGDLIEILHDGYRHWAIYVGQDYVVHITPLSEYAGSCGVLLDTCNQALVKKQLLSDVVGCYDYRINNLLDDKYKPCPCSDIVKEALSLVGKILPYSVLTANCEHFVTELRYKKAESQQVQRTVLIGVGSVCLLALLAVAHHYHTNPRKKKNKRK